MDPDEVSVGSLFFEYNEELHEFYVGRMEEVGGMMEHVQPEEWKEFVRIVNIGKRHAPIDR